MLFQFIDSDPTSYPRSSRVSTKSATQSMSPSYAPTIPSAVPIGAATSRLVAPVPSYCTVWQRRSGSLTWAPKSSMRPSRIVYSVHSTETLYPVGAPTCTFSLPVSSLLELSRPDRTETTGVPLPCLPPTPPSILFVLVYAYHKIKSCRWGFGVLGFWGFGVESWSLSSN